MIEGYDLIPCRLQFVIGISACVLFCLTLLEAFAGFEGLTDLWVSPWYWAIVHPLLWFIAPYFEDYFHDE